MKDKRRLGGASIKSANTLVFFLLQLGAPRYAQLCTKDAELPPNNRISVAGYAGIRYVKFESRVIEPHRLADGLDVGFFEGEQYAQSLEYDVIRTFVNVGYFELC